MKRYSLISAAIVAAISTSMPADAQSASTDVVPASNAALDPSFAKFRPTDTPNSTRIDYSLWDDALQFFVVSMGRSIREGAPSVEPGIGTRRVYGHESRYRLEGNRVAFTFLEDEVIQSLTDYRKDLEDIGSRIDIAQLSRNEQLAFWLNLHNVAVIEQIALAYPINQPRSIKLGDGGRTMDETPFITVAGVAMSPNDIRTRIVYPNWSNPKIIYGFFRGEIGGPSIQSEAFSAENVSILLEDTAQDFVNSLRGSQKSGRTLKVSKIYEEARPFFFTDWDADIKRHLLTYSNTATAQIIDNTNDVSADIYEYDIADLAFGERDPNYSSVIQGDRVKSSRIPNNIARLLGERGQKMEKIIKRDDFKGSVTVIDLGDLTKPVEPDEVE